MILARYFIHVWIGVWMANKVVMEKKFALTNGGVDTSSKADFVLSSRSEFHQAPIVRLVATNGLQAEQGEEQGWVPVPARGGGAN